MIAPATKKPAETFTAARNGCRLCAPLGACLAFRGVEGAMPFLHGAQGCATYIRRYLISHFREPLDIASSSFGEAAAVFGGQEQLREGLKNVVRQYSPQLIGVATTCLTETIGEDIGMYMRQIAADTAAGLPTLVHVSTPSYANTHEEGYHAAVRALVETLAEPGRRATTSTCSPRWPRRPISAGSRACLGDFGLAATLLPDFSDTLDGPTWSRYQRIPPGGTPIAAIRRAGSAGERIEFQSVWQEGETAGAALEGRCGVPRHLVPLPVGVTQTDRFLDALAALSGRPIPAEYEDERGRLVDAYVDAHKYVFGKRAVVYGEQDLVVGLAALLAEVGIHPVLCASSAESGRLRESLTAVEADLGGEIVVLEGADFAKIEEQAGELRPDLIVGGSKGHGLAKRLDAPLVRVGFPIHDRVDGPRLLHLGYRGAQQLFDRIANALIEKAQNASPVGYSYM